MSLLAVLEDGRTDFLDAVAGLAEGDAGIKPSRQGWSVLDCIEHTVTVEERYVEWLSEENPAKVARDPERELRLFTLIRSRFTKVETAEALRPTGRFQALSDALNAFASARGRTLRWLATHSETLYSIGARHPHFGELNGAECLQLIDGHVRRHADQIREIRASLAKPRRPSPSRRPTARKPFVFQRDQPDLPPELADSGQIDFSGIEGRRIERCENKDAAASSFRMEGCVLERVHLAGGKFGSIIWKDVRLTGCDLANIRAGRVELVRVEIVDCRLTGFRAAAVEWSEVLLENSDVSFAQLQAGRFRACEFDACNWQEADLQEADLRGAIFRSCNLTRADLRQAKLQNADFRQSDIDAMLVEAADVKGAIVSPAQAMVLARLLGLQIV